MASNLCLEPVKEGEKRPTVSVVIPTYNRAYWVQSAVDSVLRQDIDDIEIIVADDCSRDETENVISSIREPRLRYSRNTASLGVPGNVNEGIRQSRGRYIFILHDSDMAKPNMLREMLALLRENASVIFVHTGLEYIDDDGNIIVSHVGDYPRICRGKTWLKRTLGQLSSNVCAMTMAARNVYEQYGLFDAKFGFFADVEWSIRMCLQGDVGYIPFALLQMRPREKDHPYQEIQWEQFEYLIQMREPYFSALPGSWERWSTRMKFWWEVESSLTKTILSCLKRGKFEKLREGRSILEKYGFLLPRFYSYFMNLLPGRHR